MYVPAKLALDLKEIGFNEPCDSFYYGINNDYQFNIIVDNVVKCCNDLYVNDCYSRPTHQAVVEWFITQKCFIVINPVNEYTGFKFNTTIVGDIVLNYNSDIIYESNSIALESAFLHLINFLKHK